MKKAFFTESGICMIGTMKGLHASKMRSGWVEWAKKEIEGFEEQWAKALSSEKKKPEGRTYILRKWTKMK
jgi:hypothetical protein